jgi:O-antigen/teichoic acid export membrane protein
LTFFWAIGGALNQQYFAYYRARQEARTYIIVSILYFVIATTLNIWFVRYLNFKVAGVLYGNLAVVWGINLIAFIKFFGRDRSLSFVWMKKLFGFGFPLLFGIISWMILNSADRYFLAYYRDLSEVAVYGLGYKVGLIAQIAVVTPFQLAWAPFMFTKSASSTENVREEFSRFFTYLLTGFCFVGMGIFLFSKEIINLFGSGKYSQGSEVIPFVLIAYLFSGVFYWAGSFLNLTKKTFVYSIILILMAALNLFLDWLWIPTYGWHGAAWATVITIGGAGMLTLIAGEFAYPIRLEKARILKLLIVVGIIVLARNILDTYRVHSSFSLAIVLLLAMPLLLFIVGFFTQQEKAYLHTIPGLISTKPDYMIPTDATINPLKPKPQWNNLWKKFMRKLSKRHKSFISSGHYWIDRYESGGNSGAGSYGELAIFKAEVLNNFVKTEKITKIIEFGCGDGNQLSLSHYPSYIGFDISPKALDLCKNRFTGDGSKIFKLMNDYAGEKAELTLSLDVIFHLVEDEVFFKYMERLFSSSEKFVVIYSSNTDIQLKKQLAHNRHRNFTKWILENEMHWELISFIPNRYPLSADGVQGTFSDFYIYKKIHEK